MSSCSQLEIPAVRPSSVMFDSTWSLVDQGVSARQDLPGKTLDFTFDVAATQDKSSQDNQDVLQKGLNEASGWKRPQLSQVVIVNYIPTAIMNNLAPVVHKSVKVTLASSLQSQISLALVYKFGIIFFKNLVCIDVFMSFLW